MPGVNVPAIKVNTVGYERSWRKIAIFNVEPKAAAVRDAISGQVVLAIAPDKVVARGRDVVSQDPVWQVDFSDLVEPGRYRLAGGGAQSDAFDIGEGLYRQPVLAGQKSFYFQRCRTKLALPYARWEGRSFTRPNACHAYEEVGWDVTAYPRKERRFRLEGGWHDAGNYDMYVPSTAVAVQTLLFAYEWAPARFVDGELNIPESANRTPDVLDEVRHALLWLLSLQEPSGAFRHSETVTDWSPPVPADQDRSVRWVAERSTSATAKAVAVLAQASRLFARWDRSFAARCAGAARTGWRFLRRHPEHIRAVRKAGRQTLWDDEPKHNDRGARLAAAGQMWRAFRMPEALATARQLLAGAEETKDPQKILDGAWANVSRFPLWTLARDEAVPAEMRAQAKERLIAAAELMRSRVEESDGYRCASGPEDYYWGSNSNLMEKVLVMVMAACLDSERPGLVEMARDQWHWILGRNPNGYSMITRVGKGPDRFYHTEWGRHEPPPPGYLIGGPNSDSAGFLAPGAPAKALLWDNPHELRSGLPPHSLWHWQQSDLWDGGFVKENGWDSGWWSVAESDILYSANFVAAGTVLLAGEPRTGAEPGP
jgi:endoglucanase